MNLGMLLIIIEVVVGTYYFRTHLLDGNQRREIGFEPSKKLGQFNCVLFRPEGVIAKEFQAWSYAQPKSSNNTATLKTSVRRSKQI
ncbi:MAG: hypothetical protein M1554_02290 [Patescibacteria group bacterium]|jgi:hypothetical protein|nr:hypothetical protein [Patescibacteria group bacterium]